MNENKFEQLLLERLDKIDNRLDKIEDRLGSLEQTTAWVKGKLELK